MFILSFKKLDKFCFVNTDSTVTTKPPKNKENKSTQDPIEEKKSAALSEPA